MLIALVLCMGVVALLYSAVGHGGASGYVAVMALLSYHPEFIKQDALILNLLVSGIAFWHYYKGGFFQWKLFLPLALGSVPAAFAGGAIQLKADWYEMLLGGMLLIPAILFLLDMKKSEGAVRHMPLYAALLLGIGLGFVSGLTGIGGGVLLSPILVLAHWAGQKTTAAISAPFIFVNSAAGLLGSATYIQQWDANLIYFACITIAGAAFGALFGAKKLHAPVLKKILGVVLLIASLKLLLA